MFFNIGTRYIIFFRQYIPVCMSSIKKVLSFDVGIINLAYCILEINNKTKKFKILAWGIINLADNRITCGFIKNTGEICDKIAKHCVKIDDYNRHYFCKAHVNKATMCIRDIVVQWTTVLPDDVDECSCSYLDCKKSGEMYCNKIPGQYCKIHQKKVMLENKLICSAKKCNEPITFGMYLAKPTFHEVDIVDPEGDLTYELGHGWCTDHYDDEYKSYLKKKTKKMPQNSNKISLYYLGASMYEKLDAIPNLLQVDEVLVENQPTFINPTMKSVSAMLFSYFVMRGIHEKTKTNSTIKNIKFCSPSNKITVGGAEADQRLENAEEGKVYKVTKQLGVRFCEALIDDDPEWLAFFKSHTKRDDLADALLESFVINFGPNLPEHYATKVRQVDTNIYQKNELEADYEIECNKVNTVTKPTTKRKTIRKKRTTPVSKPKSKPNDDVDDDTNEKITIKIGRIKKTQPIKT